MRKSLFLILMLGLAAALPAARKKTRPEPTAVLTLAPTAAPTPAPLAPPWDKIKLKDGQSLEGRIRAYDAFFLEVEAQNQHKFNLPWKEVASVDPAEFSGDTALMRARMTPDVVEVSSHVERKSAGAALSAAFWPGIFVHGYGYHVAGDQDMFLSLAGAEIFGLLITGFGTARMVDGASTQDDKDTAQYLVWGGSAMFALSFAWDLVGAPISARHYNERNGLALMLAPLPQGGALLGMRKSF